MKSGGRRNIMVACVTFETVKISEPVHYYGVHTVHLLHYIRDPESERGSIYAGFFEETSEQISSSGARHICESLIGIVGIHLCGNHRIHDVSEIHSFHGQHERIHR